MRTNGSQTKQKNLNIAADSVILSGKTLDGCETWFLSSDNIYDVKTVLAYNYEDGKPWHDNTCVLEIIFHNFQDNIGDNKIRILYDHQANLLTQLGQIMLFSGNLVNSFGNNFFKPSYPVSIKIDLNCAYGYESNQELGITCEDFEIFTCKIKHKKHFWKSNPEMQAD